MSTEDSQDLSAVFAPCPECQTGLLHLQHITYFTWLNDELITVPNFPAWVCDLCGRREYDSRAIKWLNALLHPEAGRHTPSQPRRLPSAEQPASSDQPLSAEQPPP